MSTLLYSVLLAATSLVEGEVITADWTQETLPSWFDSIWQGVARPEGLVRFGLSGFIKSVREVPTLLLMRLAFGAGLCRFGMFRAVRANSRTELIDRNFANQNPSSLVR